LKVYCDRCTFAHEFYTSPAVTTSNDSRRRGMPTMEVNARAVYGFRSIGIGYALLTKLCGFLNMPPPMTKAGYDKMANRIKGASKSIAEKSMSEAAESLRKGKKTADVGVSMDGTWQRKGFSSTLGVITAISIDSGKVLDIAILSKSCKGCTRMAKIAKTDPKHHELWKLSHNCNLNYTGSSPAMETAGALKIFGRSVEKHGLYYTEFYGDGDSKAFPAVQHIYGDEKPMKNSWCQYQRDKINNTTLYKSKGELPVEVRKAILPIYTDLCKEEMLRKCLHGKTQNCNESFNGTIWNRVPKSTHVGLSTLCFGVYDAIGHFNYGQKAALDTMKLLNINPGFYMMKSCGSVNRKRKRLSVYKEPLR